MRKLTIGQVARMSGVPARTIRFYEDEGLIPSPERTGAGYRLYGDSDLVRLRILRRARLLGLDLPSIRSLLDKALSESCAVFGEELIDVLNRQREEIDRRIAELTELRREVDGLQEHIVHCCEGCDTEQMASLCSFCGILEQEGGEINAKQ